MHLSDLVLFAAGLFLAYSNGANDNIKGVATLLGSHTIGYRGALAWGTATTLAGSLSAVVLSGTLLTAFSGRGIVPATLVGDAGFLFAVGMGAGAVVLLATILGLPISTTHALIGALAGAGVALAGMSNIAWGQLAVSFALPLLLSPMIAAVLVAGLYPLLRRLRIRAGIEHDTCVCVEQSASPALAIDGVHQMARGTEVLATPTLSIENCLTRYRGQVFGITAQQILDIGHYFSAGAVSFARGLNDTPKIAALVLTVGTVTPTTALLAIGAGMAVGAVLQAMRVGKTMSFQITTMNAGQGFTANVCTSFLVIVASRLGMPVSTTHVSVGSLFGLGTVAGGLQKRTMSRILAAWGATIPAAFVVAYAISTFF